MRLPYGEYFLCTNETDLEADVPFTINTIDAFVLCFLSGTLNATSSGPAAIEALKAGDLVLTADETAKQVRQLARQAISTIFADPP
ncbi:Hint domain-containing protein [Ancylobacter defluvii]|uniref:Hedgehog/Intein (Hint) domain-containing protein n=1 Tax=Ancylobacter defluvii TaxID=1282440 RepID=A0A9W6JXI7_9HYPH|nr:Hint domain-containing protein [Ancylobacter defluvii]MBS7589363.1 Hint domain-containing protein [Ancylobacter defluvii]GLK84977.1 hypothetical protein GCM10017653_30470 [Ancylobacter defluvii]